MKIILIAAVAITIAIAAALLGDVRNSQAHADSPSDTRAAQASADASQTLRRYTLQLLRILSNPNANQWQRYRQAMPRCDAALLPIGEIRAAGDASPLDLAVIALTEELCADLAQRLNESRTVGLLLNEPEAMSGYVLIPGFFNNHVHLIDHRGRIVNSWQAGRSINHARLLHNGNLLAEVDGDEGRFIAEIDSDGNAVWEYSSPVYYHHHDFLKMPSGNVLMLAQGFKHKEKTIAAGANPDTMPFTETVHDLLVEVRPTGPKDAEVVWEWSVWDYLVQNFDATKENYGAVAEHPELIDINFLDFRELGYASGANYFDWLHSNAIDYNPELDQIVLTARNFSELWIIDRGASAQEAPTRSGGNSGKGGALLYRWGNPRAYGHGTYADQSLFLPHHAQWIAPGLPGEGNILVFNNGSENITQQHRGYSSIDEIVPPLDGYAYRREPGMPYLPNHPIWSYTAETPTDFYSYIMGCAQRLPNGNTLICDSTSGAVFQATPDGKVVWRYVYPMDGDTPIKQGEKPSLEWVPVGVFKNAVYRAYWYAPDYPGLRNYDLTPGGTIERYD